MSPKLTKTAKRNKSASASGSAVGGKSPKRKAPAAGKSARDAMRTNKKAGAQAAKSAGRLAGGTAAKKKTSTSAKPARGASAKSAAKGMGKTTTRRPAGISTKATKTVKSGNQGVRKSVSNSGVSAKKKTGVRTPSVRTPKVETPSAFRYYSNKK